MGQSWRPGLGNKNRPSRDRIRFDGDFVSSLVCTWDNLAFVEFRVNLVISYGLNGNAFVLASIFAIPGKPTAARLYVLAEVRQ